MPPSSQRALVQELAGIAEWDGAIHQRRAPSTDRTSGGGLFIHCAAAPARLVG